MENISGNLVNNAQFAKIFRINTHKYSETTEDLSSDSPKYFSPIASSAAIYQDFIPSMFFYVRYLETNCFKYFFLKNFILTE